MDSSAVKAENKYDRKNAILSIHSGAGGADANDWSEMLLRMYLRYIKRQGWRVKVFQIKAGKEGGIKNAVLEIEGDSVFGHIKKEAGVHRLVRISPFSAANLRHTSFALVEVLPEFDQLEIKIRPEDLRVDTYRASGPGGQYVNVTESAVRLTHLSTGLSAACQSERSQDANKKKAFKLLYTKLHQYLNAEKEKERKMLRGELPSAEWGSQIRSYILHPYKMVKDHRTGIKSSEPEKVLDGFLDKFIK